jgi:hypothetical protein
MEGNGNATLIDDVLRLVNAVRERAGDSPQAALPAGSLRNPEQTCPVARALRAVVLAGERRIAFCHPWYASAASIVWRAAYRDALLMSVSMPEAVYEFVTAFRVGAFPQLLE